MSAIVEPLFDSEIYTRVKTLLLKKKACHITPLHQLKLLIELIIGRIDLYDRGRYDSIVEYFYNNYHVFRFGPISVCLLCVSRIQCLG